MDKTLGEKQHALKEERAAQNKEQFQLYRKNTKHQIMQMTDFKKHQLPLSRIMKIIKADPDVNMVSAEIPALFAKACELFILDLTFHSWLNAEMQSRRTLQRNDILETILNQSDIYDFLDGVIPELSIEDGPSSFGKSDGAHCNGHE